MPRKSKTSVLKTAHTVHGKIERKPTTIDQVLGNNGTSTYRFLKDPFSEDEYSSYIKQMGQSDLYAHCQDFGIIFLDNRRLVENKLLDLFRENRAKYRVPADATPKTSNNPNFDIVSKIMAGGR
jgi:hypothetical protein